VAAFEHSDFPILGISFNPSQFEVPQPGNIWLKEISNVKFGQNLAFRFKRLGLGRADSLDGSLPETMTGFADPFGVKIAMNFKKLRHKGKGVGKPKFLKEFIQKTEFSNDLAFGNSHPAKSEHHAEEQDPDDVEGD
jgi:hypothetical protein